MLLVYNREILTLLRRPAAFTESLLMELQTKPNSRNANRIAARTKKERETEDFGKRSDRGASIRSGSPGACVGGYRI